MSIATQEFDRSAAPSEPDAIERYRALSSSAVVALAFGVLSLTAAFDYWLIVVPIVGIVWGVIALRQLGAQSEELSGRPLAMTGLVLSSLMLLAGPTRVYYEEMAPIPAGFQAVSYDMLQPDPNVVGERVPPSAIELNGKQVYIKGFVYAGSEKSGIKKFMLVRDAGTCCFGGNPKLTDRIVVSLDQTSMVYTKNIARVAGVFRVNVDQAPDGVGPVFYHLDKAELR